MIDYLEQRYNKKEYPLEVEVSKKGEIVLGGKNRKLKIKVNYIKGDLANYMENPNKIQFKLEPDAKGADKEDLKEFLKIVENDGIFKRGGALYHPDKEKDLKKARQILERISGQGKSLVCKVNKRNVNKKTLRKVVYEYLWKPCIAYFYKIGEYSGKDNDYIGRYVLICINLFKYLFSY
jgi:hypothetical protein